ncbi:MAG: CHAT domain-containing protein [Coleofasciculus sp. B1-GNL1-01]|uniref:CHAT domain-containing protein n=1 Tax=Coleofasciculus sp. B1-GNL1-01 TaxID=3068484 RepID=UPI0032FEADEC
MCYERRTPPNLYGFAVAIQNPTDNLPYTDLEVEMSRTFFSSTQVLAKEEATESALKLNQELPLAHCIHFSCHGKFNLHSPLESSLILAKDEQPEDGRLTLAEIFGLTLNQCRLVTLSACETGLTGLNDISDEYISLPSGFLYAGSPSVVSSLWKVQDFSTAFLMIKFYENLSKLPKLEEGTIAIALNQAQKWLRTLTSNEFEKLLDKYHSQIEQIFAQLPKSKSRIFKASLKQARKRQPYPFANPYYWAAFTAIGI